MQSHKSILFILFIWFSVLRQWQYKSKKVSIIITKINKFSFQTNERTEKSMLFKHLVTANTFWNFILFFIIFFRFLFKFIPFDSINFAYLLTFIPLRHYWKIFFIIEPLKYEKDGAWRTWRMEEDNLSNKIQEKKSLHWTLSVCVVRGFGATELRHGV